MNSKNTCPKINTTAHDSKLCFLSCEPEAVPQCIWAQCSCAAATVLSICIILHTFIPKLVSDGSQPPRPSSIEQVSQ